MIFTMIYCILILCVSFPLFFDSYNISFDSKTGVFGWLRPENFLYSFFVISLYTGIGCLVGYSVSMKYFSTVVIGNILLLEPIFG
jgi:hypothetical protein